jgi:hypothetical protein
MLGTEKKMKKNPPSPFPIQNLKRKNKSKHFECMHAEPYSHALHEISVSKTSELSNL